MRRELRADCEPEAEIKQRVVVVMGSENDKEHAEKIGKVLNDFGVEFDLRVASAHKTPQQLLGMLEEYRQQENTQLVFVAVAGRSNALGGFIDFQTTAPVVSCPPYSQTFSGADVFSSLRMPSGCAAVTAIETEMAALHAIKILALNNAELAERLLRFQEECRVKVTEADADLRER